MRLEITVKGSQAVIDKLSRLDAKLKNFEPEFLRLGEYLTGYYSNEAFISQGQVFGRSWPELNRTYQGRKIRQFPGRQPLEKTGTMRNSFTSKATASQLVVKNDTPYFKYHQSSAPRTVIPRRVMIGFNNNIKRTVRDVIREGVQRIIQ